MRELKTIKERELPAASAERLSSYISQKIDALCQDSWNYDYFEGAFYLGSHFMQDQVNLGIVYNDYRFRSMELSQSEIDALRKDVNVDLSIENIAEWWYDSGIKMDRTEHPIEFMLRYGSILYDKTNHLQKLQKRLQEDVSLGSYLNYWQDACLFTPAIQYKKTK